MSSLESVVIKMRSGKVRVEGDRVIFETQNGKGRADLPLEAYRCILSLQKGVDLETFILKEQSRGEPVDYVALKKTVMGLFYGNCIRNNDEILPYLEAWNYPPLKEALLLTPILRARPRDAEAGKGMVLFALVAIQLLAWVLLQIPALGKLAPAPFGFWALVFLAPGAVLSLKALFIHFISVMLGQETSGLGARFSPLGLHFEADNAFYKLHPRTGLAISTVTALALPLLVSKILGPHAPNVFSKRAVEFLLENLAIGFLSVELLPGLKTAWAQSRFELIKRGNLLGLSASTALSGLFLTLAVIGLCTSFAFSGRSAIELIRQSTNFREFWNATGFGGVGILGLSLFWSSYMLRDLLNGIELLADDLVLFSPLQNRMEKLVSQFTSSPSARARKEINEVLDLHALFQQMPAPYRAEISKNASILSLARGTRLIRQGSKSTDLFLVLSGSVGVYKRESDKGQLEMVVSLRPGAVFGEAGFFFDEIRTADVIALEPVRILRIQRPKSAMFKEKNQEVHEQFRLKMWATQAMATSDLFRSLPHEALFHILDGSKSVRFSRNEVIMREGEQADSLLICIQGSAKVSVKGMERPKIESGGVLGEIGLLWKTLRTATVTADDDSIFLRLPASQVQKLLSRNVFLGARLQEIGSERILRDRKASAA